MTQVTEADAGEKSTGASAGETFPAKTLDSLITDAVKPGTPIDGADGLLNELTKALLERSLAAELNHIWDTRLATRLAAVRATPATARRPSR
ncbi:hypothetical protein BH09ACT8_BH09ACT8_28540 [soil metagenome]